jgi:hypothetical protein
VSKQTLKHPSLLLATYWRQALKSGYILILIFQILAIGNPKVHFIFTFQFLLISPFGKIWPVRKRLELFRILIFLFQLWLYFVWCSMVVCIAERSLIPI